MDEENSLNVRLSMDDRHLKNLEKRICAFLNTLHTEPTDLAQNQFENLLIQLLSYQTSLDRCVPLQVANSKDIEEYDNIVKKTKLQQAEATTDIETLKSDLVKAQKGRDHKLEYDRVAREIMKLNTRDTYNESIASLQNDIELLKREKVSRELAFENRKKNMSELVQILKNTQRAVEEERSVMTDDKNKLMDMERGYVSSDDEGDMGLSDAEEVEEEKVAPTVNHRFQERDEDEEDEEEGIVSDAPMVE